MTTTVTSVERAFHILSLFENGQPEKGVSEISRALGVNKSTVHGIAQTLCKINMLEQNPANLKYRLGAGLVALGNLARQRLDVRRLARPFLTNLAENYRVSVFLGVFENDGITIVEKAESQEDLRISAPIGQRVSFCGGSFGKVFLAYMSGSEVERLLSTRGLKRFTETTITDPAQYRANLAVVREQGYALDDTEEYLEGVWAVSAPIIDGDGLSAVLTAVTLSARLNKEKSDGIVEAAISTAREISLRLGSKNDRSVP